MTRIADFNQSRVLLMDLMSSNEKLARSERLVATGKTYESYTDLSGDVGLLMSTKRTLVRTTEYESRTSEVKNRLDLQATQLDELHDAADNLKQLLTEAMAQGEASAFMEGIEAEFDRIIGVLNGSVDGRYVYAGTLTDQPPMLITDLNDLGAAASASDAFSTHSLKAQVRIDENTTINPTFLASELGFDVIGAIKAIKDYNDGTAAFSGPLTDAQFTFLGSQLTAMDTALGTLNDQIALNGFNQRRVDEALITHEKSITTLKTVISDIEDTDMAEAITRLNQDQIQTEATLRVIAKLDELSLMDFL